MISVSLSNVKKEFVGHRDETVTGLDGVSFEVEAGEFLVLLGPSGCGKSTSLRVIAGLEEADSGEVRIGGRIVNGVPSAERGVAMVFQSYALFPHLSVAQNMEFGLKARKVAARVRAEKVEWAAKLLGLEGTLERKPGQLSGGQRQRVALGRALVNDSSLVLMDEPLSNLDATLRGQMRREIRALQRELGLTVIYVTHDQVEAMAMADRVAVMRAGKVEQLGTPAELYRTPVTTFVATFVGSPPMNLIPATVSSEGIIIDGTSTALATSEVSARLTTGTDVEVGVRPEALELGDRHPLTLRGPVTAVEDLGADTLVTMDVSGHGDVVVRLPSAQGVAVGSVIAVSCPWFQASVFSRVDGHRMSMNDVRPTTSSGLATNDGAGHLQPEELES